MAARALAAALSALALWPAAAAAAPTALLVFVPGPEPATRAPVSPDPLLRGLDRRPGLAIGLMSPTQGAYTPQQALLDISQGARVSPTAYRPRTPGPLRLEVVAGHGLIAGWRQAVQRARRAPGRIVPGRLASAVPGGAAYVGVTAGENLDAVAATGRRGEVRAVSLGPLSTAAARAVAMLGTHRLVVVGLAGPSRAPGPAIDRQLDALLAGRPPAELVVIVQSPPPIRSLQPLPIAVSSRSDRGLTSLTTRTDGVVAGIDILPTLLRHLGVKVPGSVTGRPIRLAPRRAAAGLERLRARYTKIAPRRTRTLGAMLAAWALLALLAGVLRGRGGARWALRTGALGFLWVPAVVLAAGVLDPARTVVEAAIAVGGSLLLGALTDRAVPWPRGPLVPAVVCLFAYAVDLGAGTNLVELSMLGPNPHAGARFFGIGNELEPALPMLVLLGLAALYSGRPRSRGMAVAFAASGAAVAAVVGSGYLGADVGGVVTASVAAAVATLLVLPRGVTRRGVVVAACVPALAVALLAGLDLATGASTHFSRNVLEVKGGAGLWDALARRYQLALYALGRGLMPLATVAAAAAAVAAIALRHRVYGQLPGPAWRAALVGGLAAGVAGALSNDSGPLLFVAAVFVLGVATAYLLGGPGPGGEMGRWGRAAQEERPREPAMQESPAAAGPPEGGRPSAIVP